MSDTKKRDYGSLSTEELERRLREAFFCPDRIDGTVYQELEALREALEEKDPLPEEYSPQESWEHFLEDREDELEALWRAREGPSSGGRERRPRGKPVRAALRGALIAAVVLVLLAGAALAAGPRLWAWVSGWNAPLPPESTGSPIQQALAELGITEPVYPSFLPMDYVLTEAHISEDPLLLYELYTRGDRYISITVTSVTAVDRAQYAQEDPTLPEYRVGEAAHYIFSNGGYVTAVWYTENYFVSISGNITTRPLKRIIDSVYAK